MWAFDWKEKLCSRDSHTSRDMTWVRTLLVRGHESAQNEIILLYPLKTGNIWWGWDIYIGGWTFEDWRQFWKRTINAVEDTLTLEVWNHMDFSKEIIVTMELDCDHVRHSCKGWKLWWVWVGVGRDRHCKQLPRPRSRYLKTSPNSLSSNITTLILLDKIKHKIMVGSCKFQVQRAFTWGNVLKNNINYILRFHLTA